MPYLTLPRATKSTLQKKIEEAKTTRARTTPWSKILEDHKIRPVELHRIMSPVSELPKGDSLVDLSTLKKLEKAFGVVDGTFHGPAVKAAEKIAAKKAAA